MKKKLKHYTQPNVDSLITASTAIFWFRRDLRLADNAGLYYALRENKNVLPIFIFDTEILGNWRILRIKESISFINP